MSEEIATHKLIEKKKEVVLVGTPMEYLGLRPAFSVRSVSVRPCVGACGPKYGIHTKNTRTAGQQGNCAVVHGQGSRPNAALPA